MAKKAHLFMINLLILCVLLLYGSPVAFAGTTNLRVAFNRNMVPYQFVEADGDCIGMHIDILNWIAKEKGLELEYIPYENDSKCLSALNDGQVDIVLGHRTNDSNAYRFQSTGELSSSSLCMIVTNELVNDHEERSDYNVFTAALQYGTMDYSYMYKLGLRNYIVFGNQEMVCDALISGMVDIAVGVRESLTYILEREGLEENFTVQRNYLSLINYSILVREEEHELFSTLHMGLTELRASGEYEKIYHKWIIDHDLIRAQKAQQRMTSILNITAIGSVLALMVIMFNIRMNVLLKRKVEEKTKKISDTNIELEHLVEQLQSEGRLRNSIIEDSPSGMIFFDNNGRITLTNSAAQQIAEMNGETLIGKNIREVSLFSKILGQIRHDLFLKHEEVIERPVIMEIEEADNKQSYRCNLYRSSDYSSINGMLMTVENVTLEEREKQERFEAEKNKLLNRLVAGIAHEIKNPLMSIKTASSLILNQGNDHEIKEAFKNFVPKEIERINQLVEGLINYARPIKGKPEVLCISKLINDCLYLTHIAAKRINIHFDIEIEDDLYVFANKDKLKQSLINLIMNGIDSMQIKLADMLDLESIPRMKIFAYQKDDKVLIVIRDEGIGMTMEEVKQCTKPFFTTKSTGTGLGLAIAKQYIQENNGKLKIESEKNKFTQITLTFRRCYFSETQNTNNR